MDYNSSNVRVSTQKVILEVCEDSNMTFWVETRKCVSTQKVILVSVKSTALNAQQTSQKHTNIYVCILSVQSRRFSLETKNRIPTR